MKLWNRIDEVRVALDFGTDGVIDVGTLARANDQIFFEYDPAFLEGELNPSPFGIPFANGLALMPVREGKLGGMFADALPDGWTRRLLDTRLVEEGFDPASLSQLDRLAMIGGNGIGALSFSPVRQFEAHVPPLSLDDLAATVKRENVEGAAGIDIAAKLAGSLGGMRPKASIWLDGHNTSPAPLPGIEPWIVKFPMPGFDALDAGAVEYAYSLMARAADIWMSETRLLESKNGPGYFATARFDRLNGARYHYQSLAGIYDLDPLTPSSYTALLGLDMVLTGKSDPSAQMLRRMAFNVYASNRDDHSRNHAFLMNSRGLWVASPAFDITFDGTLLAHQLVVGANSTNPGLSELTDVVLSSGGTAVQIKRIVSEVRDVIAQWPSFAKEAGLEAATVDMIQKQLASIDVDPNHLTDVLLDATKNRGR